MYSSHLINLRVLIALILQYQEHLAELEQNIDALAEEIEEYDLIQSIPGIGHKLLQQFYRKLEKSTDLIIPKNGSPLQVSILVSSLLVSLRQPGIESPNAVLGSFGMLWFWLSNADSFARVMRVSRSSTIAREPKESRTRLPWSHVQISQ